MRAFFVILFALVASAAMGQTREPSPLKFAKEEYGFGRIKESNGAVEHTFRFVNRGQEPVAIDRVVVACGCTTTDFPRGLIKPGEKGEITVTFEPAGYRGEVAKNVTVVSGGRRYSNFLVITAKVK